MVATPRSGAVVSIRSATCPLLECGANRTLATQPDHAPARKRRSGSQPMIAKTGRARPRACETLRLRSRSAAADGRIAPAAGVTARWFFRVDGGWPARAGQPRAEGPTRRFLAAGVTFSLLPRLLQ